MGLGGREVPTRVVYGIEEPSGGRAERLVLQLAKGLPRNRYQAAVICRLGDDVVERLQDHGVQAIANERPRSLQARVRGLLAELRHLNPHIVHGIGPSEPSIRLASLMARVPALIWTHTYNGGEASGSGWQGALTRFLDSATLGLIDRHIVAGRSSEGPLGDHRFVSPRRLAVIPGAVDLSRFDPTRTASGAWRERLRVAPDGLLVGAVGRLTRWNGFEYLIQARAQLNDPRIWLVIAGDGPAWEELRALAVGLDLGDRVSFLGHIDDVPGLLADLDLFVLPRVRAGYPLALLEAMAMARPILASAVPGVDEVVSEGVDGHLVPPGDVGTLTMALRLMLRDAAAARRMGRNARKKAEREFSVERMVRRVVLLYEEVLAEKGS